MVVPDSSVAVANIQHFALEDDDLIKVHYKSGEVYEERHNEWKEVPNKQNIIAVEIISELTNESHTLWALDPKNPIFFAQRVGTTSKGTFFLHLDCKQVGDVSEFFDAKYALIITADKIDPRKKVQTPSEILFLKKKCPKCGKALLFPKLRFLGTTHNQPLVAEQVAVIKDSQGNCDVLEVSLNGVKRYSSNLKEMGLNELSLQMLGIDSKSVRMKAK